MSQLTISEILHAGLADWRKLAQALHARFITRDLRTGKAFLDAVTDLALAERRNPNLSLTRTYVDVKLISHDVGQITDRDVDLARRISAIADARGIQAKPDALAEFELALDTADVARIGPFWAALLTGDAASLHGDDVIDPAGRVPLLWFQHTDAHETPRQRFHIDLWLPHDIADQRISAAVAAGGKVVDDSHAPSFTVLADFEGNRVCICTSLDRT